VPPPTFKILPAPMFETTRLSARLCVRPSVPSIDSSSGVRLVCCGASLGQVISTDSRRRRSAADAGSVTLTADVGG